MRRTGLLPLPDPPSVPSLGVQVARATWGRCLLAHAPDLLLSAGEGGLACMTALVLFGVLRGPSRLRLPVFLCRGEWMTWEIMGDNGKVWDSAGKSGVQGLPGTGYGGKPFNMWGHQGASGRNRTHMWCDAIPPRLPVVSRSSRWKSSSEACGRTEILPRSSISRPNRRLTRPRDSWPGPFCP
jgi:hypothetical protein